jgi:hypothetical protein
VTCRRYRCTTLQAYAGLLRAMKRNTEAEKLEDRVHFLTKGHYPQRQNR